MTDYRIRRADDGDLDALVSHRLAMFAEMGTQTDRAALAQRFRDWLADALPSKRFVAWVIDTDDGRTVGGGGIIVLPWIPGPRDLGDRLPFVFNVYVEPGHRRLGLATRLMATIHAWCRAEGCRSIGLAASQFGRPLYETLGYRIASNPTMFATLD